MDRSKRNIYIISVIAIFYCLVFIPTNLRCSGNANMLVCAGTDEYAQFPQVISMISRDINGKFTLLQLLDHDHYYYGYIFYLISAIAILPVKIFTIFNPGNYTRIYILILRQLSPLFMSLSIMLLIYIWTRYKNLLASIIFFIFMASIPAVVSNNSWWHPDSMVVFFVVGTLFCLNKDEFEFGKWFFLSAISCGLAISTKLVGLFFFLTIPTYILLGQIKNKTTLGKSLLRGFIFIGIMLAAIILSYPTLLIPGKASEILFTLKDQLNMVAFGTDISQDIGILSKYSSTLRESFGSWLLFILPPLIGVYSILFTTRNRIINILILTWSLPLLIFLVYFVTRNQSYYFLPALIPFISLLGNLITQIPEFRREKITLILSSIFLCFQFSIYIPADLNLYRSLLNQENDCSAIDFYHELVDHKILLEEPVNEMRIFHDPNIYIPINESYTLRTKWNGGDYDVATRMDPDLIILGQKYINKFYDQESLRSDYYGNRVTEVSSFYLDAKNDNLRGYKLVYSSDFASVYKKVE